MGTLWIPGAERLPCSLAGGNITSTAPARAVWHTVEGTSGTAGSWSGSIRTLNGKSAEPHILYDPVTDRLGQFMALDLSARALKNDGSTRTNRVGKVCIQIEVIAFSAKPFTSYWKPGPNWKKLIAALRSWGIPDVQPAGAFPVFIASPPHSVPENDRDRSTWLTKGGHFSHSQIPGNDHGDPGGVSFAAMLAAAGTTTTKPVQPPAPEDDMPYTEAQLRAIAKDESAEAIEEYMKRFWTAPTGTGTAIRAQLSALVARTIDPNAIAAAVVAKLPAGGNVDQATVEAGVRAVLLDAATAD